MNRRKISADRRGLCSGKNKRQILEPNKAKDKKKNSRKDFIEAERNLFLMEAQTSRNR